MKIFGLKDKKIIKTVNKIRTKYGFKNVGTGHDVSHGDEVFKNMLELREHSFFNKFEFDIIGLAVMAYAHDMYADEDRKNHHILAYKKILKRKPKFLKKLSDHVFKNVCLAIKQHRASTYAVGIENPYVNIMRLADKGKPNIDDIIIRAYLYAVENNKNASNSTCVRITLKHLLDKYSYDGYAFKNDIIYHELYTESIKKVCEYIDNMSVSDLSKIVKYLN